MLERALAVEGPVLTKKGELELLLRLARGMPEGAVVVEIGSYRGRSTLAIAEGLETVQGAKLVAVDTFAGDPSWSDQTAAEEARSIFDRNTEGISFLQTIQAPSIDAVRDFEAASVDWVFIDGLHDYASVVTDIRAWAPTVKVSGLLSGHDWGMHTVRDGVLRFFSFKEIDVEYNIWMTRATPHPRPTRIVANGARHLLESVSQVVHARAPGNG